tara:strand:+ start:170 stop:373 length:204 start_codon:yes stop_codon:yes gene_type:complete
MKPDPDDFIWVRKEELLEMKQTIMDECHIEITEDYFKDVFETADWVVDCIGRNFDKIGLGNRYENED